MARATLYDQSTELIAAWQEGASAPERHADRLKLALIFKAVGWQNFELPYPLRRSFVQQTLLDQGMPHKPGAPWFEAVVEATTAYIVPLGNEISPCRRKKSKVDPLLDLLVAGAYARGAGRYPLRATRRRMQVDTARKLGIDHNRVRHALRRKARLGEQLGTKPEIDLAAHMLTHLVGQELAAKNCARKPEASAGGHARAGRGRVVPEHGTGQRWPGTLDRQSSRP